MQPHLWSIANTSLKVKMATTAYDGLTVAYLRGKVFIDEQRISLDEEFDGSDAHAVSFLLFLDHVPIGTLRYYRDDQGIVHLGRIAILKTYRQQGYGKKFLQWFDFYLLGLNPMVTIEIHAQLYLKEFYQKLGYRPVGSVFKEANIDHLRMVKVLTRPVS